MVLMVLATICFFACAFYLYVLSQWTRDKEHKSTTRPAADNEAGTQSEKKLIEIVGSRKPAEGRDRGKVRSHQALSGRERWRRRDPACDECERIAYEKIAASLRLR
jgi:hypothetical protein